MTDVCYMCPAPESTREHVPPRAFFPKSLRQNLWTIPSCETHNLDNGADVEYVRNAVSIQDGTNAVAEQAFEVAKRSWKHSPGLFKRTFQQFRTMLIGGAEKGAFPFDLLRVERVMSAIAHGLAYRDFGRAYIGQWRVFCATLRSAGPTPQWDAFREMVRNAAYEPVAVPVPQVFAYAIHRMDSGFIYRLTFYEGFVVYTWPVLTEGHQDGGGASQAHEADERRIVTTGAARSLCAVFGCYPQRWQKRWRPHDTPRSTGLHP